MLSPKIQSQFDKVTKHLYINPLEKCNLRCKICYTKKTSPILSEQQILDFVARYQQTSPLATITFCGGEVFALAYYPNLVNTLTGQGIFCQMITNGTLDRLNEFENPNFCNLIVSLDGIPTYHDRNRGKGTFATSLAFLKHAKELGFHYEIFSIVTAQNLKTMNEFEEYLTKELGGLPQITYHPRKPPTYLQAHPVSNILGETEGFDFLSTDEMLQLMRTKNVFPPKDLGCFQIALVSSGQIHGCCEGTIPLGRMEEPINDLLEKLHQRVETWEATNTLHNCLGCSQSEFMCGIKEYLLEIQKHESGTTH
ncbi:MAG TPA: radical SAM protein [Patescibacteria group bacterium]|nr:radical SAM protein [Patescibacteria group bacterium]